MRDMSKGRTLLIASAVAGAMAVVGVMAVSAAGKSGGPANFLAAASPAPTFKSNETSAHEATESAAQETAENNGTFHGGGPGGPGRPGGASNETASHEAGETAAQEAAENARAKASPTP
jgi:hypothetical protein